MTELAVIDARDGFAPQPRGWGRYARCLVEALNDLSADELDPLELAPITRGGTALELFYEQLTLPLLLRRRRAALVHATNCFLPLLRPCPGVVTIHDLAFEEWPHDFTSRTGGKYRVLTPRAARSAQRVICPSAFTRDDVCTRYGTDPEQVRIIPEAPALPITHDRRPMESYPYILAVGDLRQKKNVAALVSAYAKLRAEGAIAARLVLAGVDSGQGPRLEAIAGPAPVELTGYVSDERLDELIAGAQLLVNPSLYEGFGLVTLEAMARGTPVLAARAGALPETGGDAAAYFDPADPESLVEALRSLLADGDGRARLSEAGQAQAARFSWRQTALATIAVYRELL